MWYVVPAIAVSLIACAMALEFAARNLSGRPLASYYPRLRRWDDPHNTDRMDAIVPGSVSGSGMTMGHESFYRVPRDPARQSRIFAD